MKILKIIEGTSVDGPGLRTSIYFAGCTHHCEGCHNPQSWNINNGTDYTIEDILKVIEYNDFNVTLSGGDPLLLIDDLLKLVIKIKLLNKTIWLYTGYTWELIINDSKLKQILPYIDVVVDGKFELSKRDISLLFRGSSNQRLIDVYNTLSNNKIVEYTM